MTSFTPLTGESYTKEFEYDEEGHLIKTIYPSSDTSYHIWQNGNLIEIKNVLNVTYEYYLDYTDDGTRRPISLFGTKSKNLLKASTNFDITTNLKYDFDDTGKVSKMDGINIYPTFISHFTVQYTYHCQ